VLPWFVSQCFAGVDSAAEGWSPTQHYWKRVMTTPDEKPSSAVYVGSFDPMTLGHLDIIRRAARIFEHVTVGIGINPDKNTLFSPADRLEMCQASVRDLGNVDVRTFDGLAVEFVKHCGSRILLRGVRTLTDIEAEFTMTLTNRVLDQEIESVFLMSAERYAHISSSLIKQIAQMAKADVRSRLKDFVPLAVIEPLITRVHKHRS
jgi:pantetheine-phosphate adenylyltransferase